MNHYELVASPNRDLIRSPQYEFNPGQLLSSLPHNAMVTAIAPCVMGFAPFINDYSPGWSVPGYLTLVISGSSGSASLSVSQSLDPINGTVIGETVNGTPQALNGTGASFNSDMANLAVGFASAPTPISHTQAVYDDGTTRVVWTVLNMFQPIVNAQSNCRRLLASVLTRAVPGGHQYNLTYAGVGVATVGGSPALCGGDTYGWFWAWSGTTKEDGSGAIGSGVQYTSDAWRPPGFAHVSPAILLDNQTPTGTWPLYAASGWDDISGIPHQWTMAKCRVGDHPSPLLCADHFMPENTYGSSFSIANTGDNVFIDPTGACDIAADTSLESHLCTRAAV